MQIWVCRFIVDRARAEEDTGLARMVDILANNLCVADTDR